MKTSLLSVLGVCFALVGPAALADDGAKPAMTFGDAGESAAEQQSDAEAGEASDAPGGATKPASTATAIGAINEEIKEGKIKIEGATDPGAPPF